MANGQDGQHGQAGGWMGLDFDSVAAGISNMGIYVILETVVGVVMHS